ncbi:MAG TPA: hypothetical protein DCP90_03100 [Clostridiales bacterium]|nr:MAG: hypothetical protein A2Y22_07425 [Clostridiales bacterium GWD2_32_59]HAN09582.1 hypothetical protein [Clostridiales bacterium]
MISYNEGNKKFNFRVGAIILNGDKILIHRKEQFEFWLLPGGRVEMAEGTLDAICREMKEELGLNLCKRRLCVVSENFFKLGETVYHELGFNYIAMVDGKPDILDKVGEFHGEEGKEFVFKWQKIEDLDKIDFRPKFMIKFLQNVPENPVHIIENELINSIANGVTLDK